MKNQLLFISTILIFFISIFVSCKQKPVESQQVKLVEVAKSERLWTGVAVSDNGRIFVNYPRWTPVDTFSVCEIMKTGEAVPYPDLNWNQKKGNPSAENYFVGVQIVYMDKKNNLWILDTGLDTQQAIVPGGAKLIKIDPATNQIVKKIQFDNSVTPAGCYLNDVRVDTKINYAYITDSGLGAIIVVNLSSGESRRLLANHTSTNSEDIVLVIEGKEWLYPNGAKPQINSDGIALDAAGEYLYYQALTGRTLYRIKTKYLRDTKLSKDQLSKHIETFGESGASDGIAFGPDGNIYLSSLELNAVRRITREGKVDSIIQDSQLKWPDSFSITSDGTIYVTTSQLHLGPARKDPFKIFKIALK